MKEAEAVYRAYFAEILKLEESGGTKALPRGLERLLMEPQLSTTRRHYASLTSSGGHAEQTDRAMLKIRGVAPPVDGALVGLSSCVNGRAVVWVNKDGSKQAGAVYQQNVWLKRDKDGSLRIFKTLATVGGSC